jgi:hypothetical protein
MPFDEPVLSGLLDGGIAGSGVTVGETGVASGFVLGTVLGVAFGVKFGLVPGVTFGLVPGVAFGLGATGVVSGGIVLLGFVVVLLGVVLPLEVGLWFCGIELCAPMVLGLVHCAGLPALPVRTCANAQQQHRRTMPLVRISLCFIFSPLV